MVYMKQSIETKWILVRVPVLVHRVIKAKAAKCGMPLRDYVAQLLTKHGSK